MLIMQGAERLLKKIRQEKQELADATQRFQKEQEAAVASRQKAEDSVVKRLMAYCTNSRWWKWYFNR